ncbi:MAG: Fic family protein [Mucilaginibacter sp.]
MIYNTPTITLPFEAKENLDNIEKIIDDLNERRDKGLSKELLDNLKKQLLIKQVYHSNAIEGNKLSLRETELILNGMVINERPLKDEIEAKSLATATEYLYRLIDGREAITKRTLLELHSLIMKNIPGFSAGEFRTEEVHIKGSDHKPPYFHDVESHIDEMFQWMNRNSHKHPPLIMGAILHHWLTWIHPFSDGNGRVSRMFLNFFLLQKGYPEVIIKISDRDAYYKALIEGDKGNLNNLIELLSDNIRESISIYEELINEDQRQKAWLEQYKSISVEKYEAAKSKHSYDYEVWKNQLSVFKTLLKRNLKEINNYLGHLDINFKEYEIISFSQYLDLLEDRKVSNTWYLTIRIFDTNKKEGLTLIFYFERLYRSKILHLLGSEQKIERGMKFNKQIPPTIKLYISARKNGLTIDLDKRIDLVNIGTYKDQLSFGIINRKEIREPWQKPKLESRTDSPGIVLRHFIDQILELYFEIQKKTIPAVRSL